MNLDQEELQALAEAWRQADRAARNKRLADAYQAYRKFFWREFQRPLEDG